MSRHGIASRRRAEVAPLGCALAAVAALALVAPAAAQSCTSLLNNGVCQEPRGTPMQFERSSSGGGGSGYMGGTFSSGLGADLQPGYSDQASTFGAITIGGSGWRCSGPFRTSRC
jgi:hypothetical protein